MATPMECYESGRSGITVFGFPDAEKNDEYDADDG